MKDFAEFRKLINSINISDLITECLETKEAKEAIIKYNQEQLQNGIDAKGQVIETIASQEQNSGYPYAMYTVKERGEQGLQVQNVDLKVEGIFWNSMEVKVSDNKTEVIADFNKGANDIRDNFEKRFDFLGLTDENLKGFGQWVLSDLLREKLRAKLTR